MKITLISIAATAVLAMALTALPASPAAAQEQGRDNTAQTQHPDYSKNKFYSLGNREGCRTTRTRRSVRRTSTPIATTMIAKPTTTAISKGRRDSGATTPIRPSGAKAADELNASDYT